MAARRVFVAGSSVTRFVGSRSAGFSPTVSLEDYIQRAVDGALADAGAKRRKHRGKHRGKHETSVIINY